MSPDREFMTLEEVADLLGVTYNLIYRLVRAGDIPASKIGRVYRVARSDLDKYLEQTKEHPGGVCAACGKSYASRLSLGEQCTECEEPICRDCWTRRGVRRCREHEREE